MKDFKEIFESHYTWIEGFMRNVRRYGERNAMIDPDQDKTWTYEELNSDCNRLCNALLHDGVTKGDVVMTQLMNCPEFVFAYVACHKIHAVGSPVSFRLSPGELAQNLLDAHPKVLVFDAGKKDDVLEAMKIANFKPFR